MTKQELKHYKRLIRLGWTEQLAIDFIDFLKKIDVTKTDFMRY